ncbi:rhodanese-like domain-containing protein [Myxococcota bacterium]|nr:rhodanese-like domain-containing protein [Myxococcota bacterium]
MKSIVVLATSLALMAPAAVALACGDKSSVAEVTLTEGARLSKEKKAQFVDANGKETREKYGVIPGAVLLTSTSFEAAKELPPAKDQKLVFYCANQRCGAAKNAALRAVVAGYTDVAVLPDGIMGWKQAGLPTGGADRS